MVERTAPVARTGTPRPIKRGKVLKIHAFGDRRIGSHLVTACNTYMAEGRFAVAVTSDRDAVTCANCRKRWAE